MTAYSLFIDDSWSKKEQIFTLAGYIAPDELWQRDFEPRWRAALAEAPRTLREFKTADCRHLTDGFKGWARSEADELTQRVISIIADAIPKPHIVGMAAALAGHGAAHPDWSRTWQEYAFDACFTWAMVNFLEVALRVMHPGDSLTIVLDEKEGFEAIASRRWTEIESRIAPLAAGKKVAHPRFASSAETLPLQAADVLAYETAHEAMHRLDANPRPVSKALLRLVEGKIHRANCIWFDDLRARVMIQAQGGKCRTDGTVLFHSELPWRAEDQWPHAPWMERQDVDRAHS